jgi:hypothetical protein
MAEAYGIAKETTQPSPTTSAQGLVRDLVGQFTNPLDFYRELIQNSIDAGSNRIDVSLEYVDKGAGKGQAVIRVEDDGEGMDEHIIDNFLLVLFKSTKEDDLTKIGKFGIGFVSIFAIKPELVRVHTAKSGESWRIDFPSYKRYDKYRVNEMRDGTLVELFKTMTRLEYPKLIRDSLETIRYWCKHSETKIFFQDRTQSGPPVSITLPFELPGSSLVYGEEGTEILLGFTADAEPFFGFYNRGLTLKEGKKQFFPGVQFKAKSRYLEHTLTRDNVMEDENYRKLMEILKRLVHVDLKRKLRAELTDIAAKISSQAARPGQEVKEINVSLADEWKRRLPFFQWLLSETLSRFRQQRTWPVFPTLSGKAVSLARVLDSLSQTGVLYHDAQPNRITDALRKEAVLVLISGPWVSAVETWGRGHLRTAQASATYVQPEVVPAAKLPPAARAFLETLRSVDAKSGSKYRDIQFADFEYPGSCIRDRIFVTQKQPGALTLVDEGPRSSLFLFGKARRVALLNQAHTFVQKLAAIHDTKPGLAAYLCLKVLYLYDGSVPPQQQAEYCNLAEKVELKLLQNSLRLDELKNARGFVVAKK